MQLSEISSSKYLTAADIPPAGITYVIEYAFAEEMKEPAWDGGKQYKPAVKLRGVRKVFLFNKQIETLSRRRTATTWTAGSASRCTLGLSLAV
ncbi:MAG TPA: hypothetical protein VKB53_02510 [Gammaproteobacteria bacterium]|nr:hypothetical protein [Gammaproteobacteria bacterium]